MNTYEVDLVGLLKVTAIVTAETAERAAAIAWGSPVDDPDRSGEKVTYSAEMECLESEAPTVTEVRDASDLEVVLPT